MHGSQTGRWTSNEPLTRAKAAGGQRLLIADGHGSHIQGALLPIVWKTRLAF
jgi:hypothetical protein